MSDNFMDKQIKMLLEYDKKPVFYIIDITNLPTGFAKYGVTEDINDRLSQHKGTFGDDIILREVILIKDMVEGRKIEQDI